MFFINESDHTAVRLLQSAESFIEHSSKKTLNARIYCAASLAVSASEALIQSINCTACFLFRLIASLTPSDSRGPFAKYVISLSDHANAHLMNILERVSFAYQAMIKPEILNKSREIHLQGDMIKKNLQTLVEQEDKLLDTALKEKISQASEIEKNGFHIPLVNPYDPQCNESIFEQFLSECIKEHKTNVAKILRGSENLDDMTLTQRQNWAKDARKTIKETYSKVKTSISEAPYMPDACEEWIYRKALNKRNALKEKVERIKGRALGRLQLNTEIDSAQRKTLQKAIDSKVKKITAQIDTDFAPVLKAHTSFMETIHQINQRLFMIDEQINEFTRKYNQAIKPTDKQVILEQRKKLIAEFEQLNKYSVAKLLECFYKVQEELFLYNPRARKLDLEMRSNILVDK